MIDPFLADDVADQYRLNSHEQPDNFFDHQHTGQTIEPAFKLSGAFDAISG